jgi:D-alanyl-lipoteichoic acid acyltransferase DltB (MBOAT superfamily)
MTLSRWLRDFLFTPLAHSSRAHWWRSFAVPVVVMLLAGLWHGAAWTFVAFGAVHGVALAVERWMTERRRGAHRQRRDTLASRLLAHVVAFHVVCLGWVFFASDSLSTAALVLRRLVTEWHGTSAVPVTAVALLLAVLVAQLLPRRVTAPALAVFLRLGVVGASVALAVALLVIDALGPTGVAPFIYYRF